MDVTRIVVQNDDINKDLQASTGITPQLAYTIARDASCQDDSRQFFTVLMDQSLIIPIKLIKRFLGDDPRLDAGTIGEPFPQPRYLHVVREHLMEGLFRAAQATTIGVPKVYHVCEVRKQFPSDSWWTVNTPDLPLSAQTLMLRTVAWHIYWFAEYPVDCEFH